MTLYEIEVLNNKGKPITLEQYKGKVLLISDILSPLKEVAASCSMTLEDQA